MRTNIDLDDSLVNEAMKITGIRVKKTIINLALEEFIKAKHRHKILAYRGRNIWEGSLEDMRKAP